MIWRVISEPLICSVGANWACVSDGLAGHRAHTNCLTLLIAFITVHRNYTATAAEAAVEGEAELYIGFCFFLLCNYRTHSSWWTFTVRESSSPAYTTSERVFISPWIHSIEEFNSFCWGVENAGNAWRKLLLPMDTTGIISSGNRIGSSRVVVVLVLLDGCGSAATAASQLTVCIVCILYFPETGQKTNKRIDFIKQRSFQEI